MIEDNLHQIGMDEYEYRGYYIYRVGDVWYIRNPQMSRDTKWHKPDLDEAKKFVDERLRNRPGEGSLDCHDCGLRSPGMYLLEDELWDRIWPDNKNWKHAQPHGFKFAILCIRCAEKRAGRPFTINDFQNRSINDPIFYLFHRFKKEEAGNGESGGSAAIKGRLKREA